MKDDDFFVGYLDEVPPGVARLVRNVAALLLTVGVLLAAALVAGQRPFDKSAFEFGDARTFEGILRVRPYPILMADDGSWLLVGEGKFGTERGLVPLHGMRVRVQGTRIHRPGGRMIEVVSAESRSSEVAPTEAPTPIGPATLRGEIVDPKCWLGVMNPGKEKPHRACAIRCLSGGIPPVLVVRDASGAETPYLLVGRDGRSLSREVLRFAALPVEASGDAETRDGLRFLRLDPREIHLL